MARFSVATLESRCLDVLANNIETLITELNKEKNAVLKKFIQRDWTNDMIKKVDVLQKGHALFFINSHLKELVVHEFCPTQVQLLLKLLRSNGQGILSLSIRELTRPLRSYSKRTIRLLAMSLPSSLTSLKFSGVKCYDADLRNVAKNCPNLQELHLYHCREITDNGIKALFSKTKHGLNTVLQFLDLRKTSVTDKGIVRALQFCPNLTHLLYKDLGPAINVAYCQCCSKKALKPYHVKTLTINSDLIAPCRVKCFRVENLQLFNLDRQRGLEGSTALKMVKIAAFQPLVLSPFLKTSGSYLKSLIISGYVTISSDSLIKFCPNLVHLQLLAPHFGNYVETDATKYSLRNLRTVFMSNINLDRAKQEIRALFLNSSNIETINFHFTTGVNEEFVSFITMHHMHLREFGVRCCDVDFLTMRKIIMTAPYISYVFIGSCSNISSEQCDDLRRLKDGLTIIHKVKLEDTELCV